MSRAILTFFQCTAAAAVMLTWIATAAAAPLDPAACEVLKIEHDSLTAAGVETDMGHGPEWAKTNLQPERLKQIARLIELNEQLSFRCGQSTMTARPSVKEPSKSAAKDKDNDNDGDAAPKAASKAPATATASAQPEQPDDKPAATKKKKTSNKAKKGKDTAAAPADADAGTAQKH